jgi:N utilization substance protein A
LLSFPNRDNLLALADPEATRVDAGPAVRHFEGLQCGMVHLRTRGKIMARAKRRKEEELGANSAGQSGDTQQMPNDPEADSESVQELVEEGNAFEADAVQGVEEANDPDVSEVITHQVPEDDVPDEYLDDDDRHVA